MEVIIKQWLYDEIRIRMWAKWRSKPYAYTIKHENQRQKSWKKDYEGDTNASESPLLNLTLSKYPLS